MSLDGGGDGLNWTFYSYKNYKLKFLENSKTFYSKNSLTVHDTPADIYSNTTKFLGLKDSRRGKIMGLSAQGKDIYAQLFESLLTFKNGRFVSRFGPQKERFSKHNWILQFLTLWKII